MAKTTALSLIEDSSKFLPSKADIDTVMEELGDILSRRIFGVITIAGGGAGVFKVLEPGADVQLLDNIIYYGLPAVLHSVAQGSFRKRGKKHERSL